MNVFTGFSKQQIKAVTDLIVKHGDERRTGIYGVVQVWEGKAHATNGHVLLQWDTADRCPNGTYSKLGDQLATKQSSPDFTQITEVLDRIAQDTKGEQFTKRQITECPTLSDKSASMSLIELGDATLWAYAPASTPRFKVAFAPKYINICLAFLDRMDGRAHLTLSTKGTDTAVAVLDNPTNNPGMVAFVMPVRA